MPCLKSLRGESAVDWSCSSVLEPAHKTLDNTITDRRLGFVSANDGDSSRLVDVVSVEIRLFLPQYFMCALVSGEVSADVMLMRNSGLKVDSLHNVE